MRALLSPATAFNSLFEIHEKLLSLNPSEMEKSFNSLFEIQGLGLRGERVWGFLSFNSLFEIRLKLVNIPKGRTKLSILFLRFYSYASRNPRTQST